MLTIAQMWQSLLFQVEIISSRYNNKNDDHNTHTDK